MVDGQAGVTNLDLAFARQLRKISKPIHLVVNKTDGLDLQVAMSEFFSLGFAEPFAIAASQKRGITKLMTQVLADFAKDGVDGQESFDRLSWD